MRTDDPRASKKPRLEVDDTEENEDDAGKISMSDSMLFG